MTSPSAAPESILNYVRTVGPNAALGSILNYACALPAAPCACRLAAPAVAGAGGLAGAGGRRGGGGNTATVRDLLEGTTTTAEECAENVEHRPGTPCASRPVIGAITAFANAVRPAARAGPAPRADAGGVGGQSRGRAAANPVLPTAQTPEGVAVRIAAAALGCDSESCVVAHPEFHRYAAGHKLLSKGALALELETRYKAAGPRDTKGLLSNYNIDDTLRRWARVFPEFYPCPFAMMDFERNGDRFGRVDLAEVLAGRAAVDLGPGFGTVQRPSPCFGCVLNTDTSSGPGKHWVAVFVDCRPSRQPWTVEYFNSAGHPPPRPVVRWAEKARAQLVEYRRGMGRDATGEVLVVPVTDIDHQESQTECGLYALYYIRRRLEGTPYRFFFEQRVPDDAMTAFRAHVFRAGP